MKTFEIHFRSGTYKTIVADDWKIDSANYVFWKDSVIFFLANFYEVESIEIKTQATQVVKEVA